MQLALQDLASKDAGLGRLLARLGPPPLWSRTPGFATLVHIILEQQVSLASARAAFERLGAALGEITPAGLLTLDDAALKTIGFSRQKSAYARGLAQALLSGQLDLDALTRLPDDAARQALLALKGIGPWSADIYLLMALRRPDIWPGGDLALAVAVQHLRRLPARPAPAELEHLSQDWRPWRAVAARLLWHSYLSGLPEV